MRLTGGGRGSGGGRWTICRGRASWLWPTVVVACVEVVVQPRNEEE